MDKSWMTKWRGSREYMEGAEVFVKYAVTNSKNKNSMVCPCRKCGLNRSLRPEEAYGCLIGERAIMPNYTEWIWHEEKIRAHVPNKVPIVESPKQASAADNVPMPNESRTMQSMLQDFLACIIFGQTMVSVKWKCKPNMYLKQLRKKEIDERARKFYKLVQDADKPLHDKTQYSKLSAIVHLYNLKFVGGLRNTIFTSLLEFINEIVSTDEPALPKSTYE
jgi:hypothetical protein